MDVTRVPLIDRAHAAARYLTSLTKHFFIMDEQELWLAVVNQTVLDLIEPEHRWYAKNLINRGYLDAPLSYINLNRDTFIIILEKTHLWTWKSFYPIGNCK